MIFILSKILLFILQPIIWVFLLMLFALLSRDRLRRKIILIFATALLFVFSNRYLVGKIYNFYEGKYPIQQKYDFGILLGGFSKSTKGEHLIVNDRGDRLIQTIYLFKSGKIKKILLSGGSGKLIGSESIEANLASVYLRNIGIPDSCILVENQSKNTIENAKFSEALMNRKAPKATVLVITSAWHIPRSKMIFDRVFKRPLTYYPTDFIGKEDYDISDYYLPDADALRYWPYILKEWVGLFVDRVRI